MKSSVTFLGTYPLTFQYYLFVNLKVNYSNNMKIEIKKEKKRYTVLYCYYQLGKLLQCKISTWLLRKQNKTKQKTNLDKSQVKCPIKWQNFPQCIVYILQCRFGAYWVTVTRLTTYCMYMKETLHLSGILSVFSKPIKWSVLRK